MAGRSVRGRAVAVWVAVVALLAVQGAEVGKAPQGEEVPHDTPHKDTPCGKGKSVVVIGAGLAGLTAAVELKALGCVVTVLEGQDRMGGRLKAFNDGLHPPGVYDIGGQWIHGHDQNPLVKFCRAHGLTIQPTGDKLICDLMFVEEADGRTVKQLSEAEKKGIVDYIADAEEKLEKSAKELQKEAHNMKEQPHGDMTGGKAWEKFIGFDKQPEYLKHWTLWSEFDNDKACSPEQISWHSTLEYFEYEGNDSEIETGLASIVPKIATSVQDRVLLNHKVVEVRWQQAGDEEVEVTFEDTHSKKTGSIKANYAIITTSVAMLQTLAPHRANVIKMVPDVPARQRELINGFKMGVLNKFILRFEKAFWPENTYSFGYIPHKVDLDHSPFEIINMIPVHKVPALVFITGGAYAERLEGKTDDQLKEMCLHILAELFPENVKDRKLELFKASRWLQDEWAYGAYMYVPPGRSAAEIAEMRHPLVHKGVKRVYFAGESFSRHSYGMTYGAMFSGQAAARSLNLQWDMHTGGTPRQLSRSSSSSSLSSSVGDLLSDGVDEVAHNNLSPALLNQRLASLTRLRRSVSGISLAGSSSPSLSRRASVDSGNGNGGSGTPNSGAASPARPASPSLSRGSSVPLSPKKG